MKNKRILIFSCIAILFVVLIFGVVKLNSKGKSNEGNASAEVISTIFGTTSAEHITTVKGTDEQSVNGDVVENMTSTDTASTSEFETTVTVPATTTEAVTSEKATTKPSVPTSSAAIEVTSTAAIETTTPRETETETRPKPTTEAPTTTVEEVTTTQSQMTEEVSSTEFSFVKYAIKKMPTDYRWDNYLVEQGYVRVNNWDELVTFSKKMLGEIHDQKVQKYILAPKDAFDNIANELENLNAIADSNPTAVNLNNRDEYFFNALGLDYQYYYTRGYSIFKIKKIQDVVNSVNNYSVYAIYSYAYETLEQRNSVDAIIGNIISNFTGTDYEKAKAAHDYLCDTVVYCDDPVVPISAHSAYGALINKNCVCDGYAKAYKLLLNAMNISCDIVVNNVHGWNEIYIEGAWYLVDVTNDDSNSASCYFMLGKDVMYSDVTRIVDGYIFNEDQNKQISYYNYKDGLNTSKNNLSDVSYNWKDRIK